MTQEERIAHSRRADAAIRDFLGPAFRIVIADYAAKHIELCTKEPWESDKQRKLAMAISIAREVEKQIVAIVKDGDVAMSEKKRAEHIAAMPEAKRKWALMGGL